eukprot:SAG22_NODE_1929_length_3293_cov_3.309956_1_plen_71_part_00
MPEATAIDYGSSFLFFRDGGTPESPGANHTPRAQIDASCTLKTPDMDEPRRYFAGVPCATERMYAETELM